MQRIITFLAFITILLLFLPGCFEEVVDPNDNDNNGNGEVVEFDHKLAPGESNEAFVTNEEFEELIIEVQFMPGTEPEEEALAQLVSFLNQHLQKSEITVRDPVEISSGGQNLYLPSDIEEIESNNREYFTEENQLAAYVLFLDGEFENQDAAGFAQFNTSFSVFHPVVDRVSGPLQSDPSKASVEATIMKHQFGHLMGLVNNGTDIVQNHHDALNGPHCTIENCLMNFRLNSANFFETLFQDIDFVLDPLCVQDLEALKN